MSANLIEQIEKHDTPAKWLGYTIRTSDPATTIIAKISNGQSCCEVWGVHTKTELLETESESESDLSTDPHPTPKDLIGSVYQSLEISTVVQDFDTTSLCVTIQTDKGNLVLTFYNEHNGYYPHEVWIESEYGIKRIEI